MDVAILCGGYGTRLSGLWNGPKALVPLGDGTPIIIHLLRRAWALRPASITLLTGYGHDAIVQSLRREAMLHPRLLVMHSEPAGTAAAIRQMQTPAASLLVLNGDTLPRYDLKDIADTWRAERVDIFTAWCGGKHAGATVLSENALTSLCASAEPDLDVWRAGAQLNGAAFVSVRGFLDVGTPEGFALARKWTEGL